MNLNKVFLCGNLTRDPELSYIASGTALAKFGVAVNEKWRDKSGENKEKTTFVDVDCWAKTAEFVGEHFSKGKPIFIEGSLNFSEWQAQDGSKRSKISVTADRVQFVGNRPTSADNTQQQPQAQPQPAQSQQQNQADTARDLPF